MRTSKWSKRMEPLRSPPPPPPPPPPSYAAHLPRSTAAGRGPWSPRVSTRSPPRGRPPHPARAARDGSWPQIEQPSRRCSSRAPLPHRPGPGVSATASAAAHGESTAPFPRPDLRLGATAAVSAAVAAKSERTGGTSSRRVRFASTLCYRPVRRYYPTSAAPTRSCLRSASGRRSARSAGLSSPTLVTPPGFGGDFPSRGGRPKPVTGAWQRAGAAHSSEGDDGWSMVRPRYWWCLPGFKTKAHSTPSTTQVLSARHHLVCGAAAAIAR